MTSTGQQLQKAVQAHQAGDFAGAAKSYRAILALDKQNADATHLLGLVELQFGRTKEAIRLLEVGVNLRPKNPTFRFNLGVAYGTTEQFGMAIKSYRRAAKLKPNDPNILNNLGLALGSDGQLQEAEKVLRQALLLDPDLAITAVNLADVLCRLALPEQMQEAERLCRRVLSLPPEMAKAHAVLARSLTVGNRQGEAVVAIKTAVQLEPGNGLFQEQLAELSMKSADPKTAEVAARHAVRINPTRARSAGLLGSALLAQEKLEDAKSWLHKAIKLDPTGMEGCEAGAAANLYVAYLKKRQYDDVSTLLNLDQLVFPVEIETPEDYENLQDFNTELARAIKDHPSLQWNPAGYVTRKGAITGNVLLDAQPIFKAMEIAIRNGIELFLAALPSEPTHHFKRDLSRRFRMVMWAVILDQEGHLETHIHEGSWISGVYYVSIPDFEQEIGTDAAGAIEFGRPAKQYDLHDGFTTRIVKPQDGRLVLFPSSMFHRTIPFRAEAERICISFNCFPY